MGTKAILQVFLIQVSKNIAKCMNHTLAQNTVYAISI